VIDTDDEALVALGQAAGHLLAARDEVEYSVRAARRHGATWRQIGDELGISKQAAQQRYGRHDLRAPCLTCASLPEASACAVCGDPGGDVG
jgi:hypothetical protein